MNVARGHVFFDEHLCNPGRIGRIGRIGTFGGPRQRAVLGGKIFEVTGAEASSLKKDGSLSWRPSGINWPCNRHREELIIR